MFFKILLESVTQKVSVSALRICNNTFCFFQNAEITAVWFHACCKTFKTRAAVQEKIISLPTREKQLAVHAYSNCVPFFQTLNKPTIVKFKTAAFKRTRPNIFVGTPSIFESLNRIAVLIVIFFRNA